MLDACPVLVILSPFSAMPVDNQSDLSNEEDILGATLYFGRMED
jgi:hypothetical protein